MIGYTLRPSPNGITATCPETGWTETHPTQQAAALAAERHLTEMAHLQRHDPMAYLQALKHPTTDDIAAAAAPAGTPPPHPPARSPGPTPGAPVDYRTAALDAHHLHQVEQHELDRRRGQRTIAEAVRIAENNGTYTDPDAWTWTDPHTASIHLGHHVRDAIFYSHWLHYTTYTDPDAFAVATHAEHSLGGEATWTTPLSRPHLAHIGQAIATHETRDPSDTPLSPPPTLLQRLADTLTELLGLPQP